MSASAAAIGGCTRQAVLAVGGKSQGASVKRSPSVVSAVFLKDKAQFRRSTFFVLPPATFSPRVAPLGKISCKYLGNAQPTHAAGQSAGTLGPDSRVGNQPTAAEAGAGSFLVAILIPLIAGVIVSSANKPTTEWYRSLKKPSWCPPDSLFGAAWSVLYAVMGFAAWLVWKQGGVDIQQGPLTLYGVQLVLNLLWPLFCFGFKNLGLALLDILALDFAILATIRAFAPVDPFAAQLLYPYLAWCLFATALNYNLWRINRGGSAPSPHGTSARGQAYSS